MFKGRKTRSTQRKKRFRIYRDNFIETFYSPLLGESENEGERSNPSTTRGAFQSDNQGTFGIPHPIPPPPPPPPPPPFNMVNVVKMLVFKGQGLEDLG